MEVFFNDGPEDKQKINVHHLLSHSSGLPQLYGDPFEVVDVEKNVRSILQQELLFVPGEKYNYSNIGYNLLAAIVEIVAKRSFFEYLQEEILLPAGVKDVATVFDGPYLRTLEIAYDTSESELSGSPADWRPSAKRIGAGGLFMAIDQLWSWQEALSSGKILSRESLRLMMHPNLNNYAYGMVSRNDSGSLHWYHLGYGGSSYAYFHMRGDVDFAVFLLTNESPEGFSDEIESIIKAVELKLF